MDAKDSSVDELLFGVFVCKRRKVSEMKGGKEGDEKMKGREEKGRENDNYSGEGEVVKDLGAVLPGVGVRVLLQAFIVEAVDLGNLSALVVSAEEGDLVGVAGLEDEEVCKGLETVVAAVDKVSHEDVVCVGDLSSGLKEVEKVRELTVNVSADGDRRVHGLHVGLLEENLLYLFVCALRDVCVGAVDRKFFFFFFLSVSFIEKTKTLWNGERKERKKEWTGEFSCVLIGFFFFL